MNKKCIICGAPCRSKYCSQQCMREAYRRKYRKDHPRIEYFYVFYDKSDFVTCCGTAQELVEQGAFDSINAVHSRVSKINAGTSPGKVVTIKTKITEV